MVDARKQRDPIGPNDQNYFDQQNGLFTVQYPKEQIPVPDHGRYKLHNEIEDCIVCDKCAKVCPVNCIEIEPVRATEEFGKTSDGTPLRIYAAKFDIDMAKCCFCGLCTTVCPTECLTMTSEYDFSAFDFAEHNVPFANMSPLEILEKKKELEEFNKKKEEAKAKAQAAPKPASSTGRPVIKSTIKPVTTGTAKPVMKPKVPGTSGAKPVIKPKVPSAGTAKPKVIIKPKIQVKKEGNEEVKPKVRPVIRPKVQSKKVEEQPKETPKPKIPMKPIVPPRKKDESEDDQ
ncbi:4Fe-4S dicluster domain-containing protein [Fabibacter sp. E12]|nr:4Fe-4S dicluster domain-containing protein [Roseivirga sp. E12]